MRSQWIEKALCLTPLQRAFDSSSRNRFPILAYHDVRDAAIFEAHLDLISRMRHPVSADQVVDHLAGGVSLPADACLVTFDDGDRTIIDKALPLLRTYQIPAIVFVVGELLDGRRPVWTKTVRNLLRIGARSPFTEWVDGDETRILQILKKMPDEERIRHVDELAECVDYIPTEEQLTSEDLKCLEAEGMTIGNHTYSHPRLDRCSSEKVDKEIRSSHHRLTSILGREPKTFAYPDGAWDPRAAAILHQMAYRVGFLFDHRLSARVPLDALQVSRLRIDTDASLERLRLVLSGLHSAIYSMTSALRRRTSVRSYGGGNSSR